MHKTREEAASTRLGAALDAYRRINAVGLRELAAEIGLSPATLSRIERGHGFDLDSFAKLLAWFRSAA